MRPPTHTDPDAIPRNGTEVPWVDIAPPEPDPERAVRPRAAGAGKAPAAGPDTARGGARD
jgi:hypothetical protein